jgi:pilus assembly protein Flp/PilA
MTGSNKTLNGIYTLLAAGISIAIIALVNGMGTKLKTTFSSISPQLK